MAANAPRKFPRKYGDRRHRVIVYRQTTRRKGNEYHTYTVDWRPSPGERRRESRSSWEEADALAVEKLWEMRNASETVVLDGEEKDDYNAARGHLERLNYYLRINGFPIGQKTLTDAVRIYADAMRHLGTDAVVEACRIYADSVFESKSSPPVSELVRRFLADKKAANVGERWYDDLRLRLGRFADDYGDHSLPQINGATINDWLASLGVGPQTRNHYLTAVSSLCVWARDNKHISRVTDPLAGAIKAKVTPGTPNPFTPDEMKALLKAADEQILPFLAVGAFAGCRRSELLRLEWGKHVNVKSGKLRLTADVTKTSQRRAFAMKPNLRAWLKTCAKDSGPICEYVSVNHPLRKIAKRAGVEWRNNGLRDSFISYRLAECQDLGIVAYEAGNSRSQIQASYAELVDAKDARAWFKVRPS